MNEEAILNEISFKLLLLVFCKEFGKNSIAFYDLIVKNIRNDYVNFFIGDESAISREKAKHLGIDYGENINNVIRDFDKLALTIKNNIINILADIEIKE